MSPDLSSIARGVPDVDLLRTLAATNRKTLERFIATAIEIMDDIDAPAEDLEPEDDYSGGEDDFDPARPSLMGGIEGAGCVISDDDCDHVYKSLRGSAEGRAFLNARRIKLGLPPIAPHR